jgi:hypothetical protein
MMRKLAGVYREYGLVLGLLYGLDRALQRFSSRVRLRTYELMVQPIGDKPLLPERLTRRLEIREIKPGDPELARIRTRRQIELRFAQEAVCLGAFRDGRFLGYLWFCHRAYEEDEVRCTYRVTPEAHAVFDFDLYIFPEYRMGTAFAALWQGANGYLRERGIRFTFSRLAQLNMQSRRAHDHLGWTRVGRAVFFVLGPVQLMVATVRPYLHISLSRAGRVELRLAPGALTDA